MPRTHTRFAPIDNVCLLCVVAPTFFDVINIGPQVELTEIPQQWRMAARPVLHDYTTCASVQIDIGSSSRLQDINSWMLSNKWTRRQPVSVGGWGRQKSKALL